MAKCDCYFQHGTKFLCYGTKEMEECSCGGDESKCNFYPEKRKQKMANEKRLMKAWLVREKDEFCATVVFAETRGKARALALHTETCEDANFCDIEANRRPALDKYYVDGKKEMDWLKSEDCIALVKDGGFICSRDWWEPQDCERCPATEWCDMYQDMKIDGDGNG